MWDDDSPLKPDLLLRKSLSVEELVKEDWVIFDFRSLFTKFEIHSRMILFSAYIATFNFFEFKFSLFLLHIYYNRS